MDQIRETDGWYLAENRPNSTNKKVLLLPGLLCTDLIYEQMLSDSIMEEKGIYMIAGNPPGFKGQATSESFDFSIESYAALVIALHNKEKFDLIVGHSFFGNVLIELAVNDTIDCKLMLISPSLYHDAEPSDTRTLNTLSRIPVLSGVTWWVTYIMLNSIFSEYFIEEQKDKLNAVVNDAKRTPKHICRKLLMSLFSYIDKYEDLSKRLISTKVPIHYVRGTDDNIGFSDEVRATLISNNLISIKDIEGSRHFVMIDKPHEVNKLILEMLDLAK